ncbi:MAG: hypothetical protein OEY66_09240 [Gammaproteobacteria bacterium]|nr:hypothetical protein [Gammaproteobacteria bacterium]
MKNVIMGLFLISLTGTVNASMIWDWSFPDSNITLAQTEIFYIGGTITNDITSTESLNIGAYSWWVSAGDLSNSDFTGNLYMMNITSYQIGGLFENDADAIIAPGESFTFTLGHFDPILPISLGTEFTWSVRLFNDLYGPNESNITKTISATVVPLPASLWLMFSGVFSLSILVKKK